MLAGVSLVFGVNDDVDRNDYDDEDDRMMM